MAEIAFDVNGRTYQLACQDGEEPRLRELAGHVSSIVDQLAGEFGQIAPERLMLMAAIMTADELWDVRERLDKMSSTETRTGSSDHSIIGRAVTESPGGTVSGG